MSKKHTRKPAPYYPPSWYEISELDTARLNPYATAIVETIRRTVQRGSR